MSNVGELSGLEPAAFEHLVNAIALKVLGSGATGFGPGPDAGRDGWFEGEAAYPSTEQHWKGIWYIQAKFHPPHLSKDPQKWLLEQIRAELAAFSEPTRQRKWPDNWIIATNIDPSGSASKGSFDQARKLVQKARPKLAPRFHIWGGQKLCAWLDEFPFIARRFGHFLTPGHVIAALLDQLDDERASVEDIVRYTVVRGIEDQRQTRLEQAGSTEDRRPGIHALFVDLPYADPRCNAKGRSIVSLASASAINHRVDEDEVADDAWRMWRAHPKRSGVWFVRAGPGRGKSSIGQFFCQVQRAALILQPGGIRVHRDIKTLSERIRERAEELACWPSVPRIPLWVELKSYAAWFAEQAATAPRGVATFLCSTIHRDTEATVAVKTLRRALRQRSWVVIFDGLDEVPSDVKDAIASEVVNFARDTSITADILVICTSRPQGYAGQFDALGGAVVDLVDLPPELALECAAKVAAVDRAPDEAARAHALLARALQSPAVRELLTTPLQAHIMAVLVRNGQRPPERKWDLYDKFYEVIREREANRELPDAALRDLFQRDPGLIDAVHQRLGFALHTKAERASGADASLSKAEFRILIEAVVQETRRASDVAPIVEALIRATTERLVLINTPDQGDRVRFDIRAIQEFFAAEFLYVDTPADVLAMRLEFIAGDSHWREVVQFVMGALTALKRATEWTVALDALRALDSSEGAESVLARRLARGALHCALFFDNGAAEHSRKVRDQLRPVIDPIAGSSDEYLLEIMQRVSTPESREWLMGWAQDEIRRLQPSESTGALRILAALCPAGVQEAQPILTFLETLETKQVGDLLMRLFREQHRRAESGNPRRWELEAETRLMKRNDCVAKAPMLVSRLLWHGAWHSRNEPSNARRSSRPRQLHAREVFIRDVLSRTVSARPELESGGVIIREWHLARNSREVVAGATSGLLRWLELLHDVSSLGGVKRTQEALAWLGKDWTATRQLPVELRSRLPIPTDERITPETVSKLIADLADDEFERQLVARAIKGVLLQSTESDLFGFTMGTLELNDSVAKLLRTHPKAAWHAWCLYWRGDRHLSSGAKKLADELRNPSEALIAVRQQLAATIERDPFLALSPHESYFLAGLAALDGEQARVLSAFRAGDLRWPLRFDQVVDHSSVGAISLELPEDTRLLPVVAGNQIAAALGTLRRGDAVERYEQQETIHYSWRGTGDLQEVIRATANTPDERAAALLLVGLKGEAGWSQLVDSRSLLLEFAGHGVPVAAGTAVVAEVGGLWSDPAARRLISDLIAAERGVRRAEGFGDRASVMNVVVHAWRERSTAPLTKAGAVPNGLGYRLNSYSTPNNFFSAGASRCVARH